jgi:NAD(P)-dependent dehydrogenase (short-subunit alcohol dehydrogenase family)
MGRLEGRVALVTGASKPTGIGAAIALRFAREGADVVIADRGRDLEDFPGYCRIGNTDEMNELAEELKKAGVKALAHPVDVTDPEQIAELSGAVERNFGRLNILVNNAGASPGPNAIEALDEKAWMTTLDINLHGTFRVTRALLPLLKEGGQGGSIINTASRAGKVPRAYMASYCVAKAGVIMLTRVMAIEFAKLGIRCNCICPGQIDTELGRWGWRLQAFADGRTLEQGMDNLKKGIPAGRVGTPEEVADLVAFLASDESSYITGQAINITGGQLMEL